jgi:hypothetical protein
MAYIKKYSFPFATKYEVEAELELWEDVEDETIYEFTGIAFNIQYIPTSDDPFEPIYATQLGVSIDVTDEATGYTSEFIPDLTTLNDRKYLAKLYIDGNIQFIGWTLSDAVNISFTTGRKELSFNCVDGLVFLKDIKFSVGEAYDVNQITSVLSFLTSCLNQIAFPTNLNLYTSISYYAEGMDDRSVTDDKEPFNQTYLFAHSFLDGSGLYKDCYSILVDILISFGARIIQVEGKWCIYSINQIAQENKYFTQYDSTGTLIDSGIIDSSIEVQSFTANTSNLYFIDNSQTKLLMKGYNNIISNNDIRYPENLIFNWDLKYVTSGVATGFSQTTTGGAIITIENYAFVNASAYQIDTLSGAGSGKVLTTSESFFPKGSAVDISFVLNLWEFGAAVVAQVILIITGDTQTYYYSKYNDWRDITLAEDYYEILGADIPADILGVPYSFNLTTEVLPFGGELQFGFFTDNQFSLFVINNFVLTISSLFTNVLIESRISEADSYTLNIQSPLGLPANGVDYYNYNGYLMLSDGTMAKNWYRYEYPVETFRGLAQLLVRQYMNIYQQNIINIDCNLSSVNTNSGVLNGFKVLQIADDNDPASINVSSNYYMFGNTTMNLYADEVQSTLLEINNINIEGATIETTYTDGDVSQALPENCYCYEVTGVEDGATYTYTDCNGLDNFMSISNGQSIYVSAASIPSVSGATVVLVDAGFCSI